MESRTKEVQVEMSLEEACDLYDKGWVEDPVIKFRNLFEFIPFGLSELIKKIQSGELNRQTQGDIHISDGRFYLGRADDQKIQIRRPVYMPRESWKKKDLLESAHLYSLPGDPWLHQVYSHRDFLNLTEAAKGFSNQWEEEGKCDFNQEGLTGLEQASSLPIFSDKNDYEAYLRKRHGDNFIDERLRKGEGFRVVYPSHLSKEWKLLIACVTPGGYSFDNDPLFHVLDEGPKEFFKYGLIGTMKTKNYQGCPELDGQLLNAYARPTEIGNGVIVMSQDRIPKYLQRRLGLGGVWLAKNKVGGSE